jgi:hypothetical protein
LFCQDAVAALVREHDHDGDRPEHV